MAPLMHTPPPHHVTLRVTHLYTFPSFPALFPYLNTHTPSPRAVRDMLARGLSDPYCRFIGPAELDAMKKYDVSGVGLNLGTAAEYVVKTVSGWEWEEERGSPAWFVLALGMGQSRGQGGLGMK